MHTSDNVVFSYLSPQAGLDMPIMHPGLGVEPCTLLLSSVHVFIGLLFIIKYQFSDVYFSHFMKQYPP